MKKFIPFTLLLTFLVGCEAPQRTRAPATYVTGDSFSSGNTGGNGFSSPGTVIVVSPGSTTGSSIGTTSGTNQVAAKSLQSVPGFESCDITARFSASGIGSFGICRNTQNNLQFAVHAASSGSDRICLIPTYKTSNGSSTYIGEPQCFFPNPAEIKVGTLIINRPNYTLSHFNGLMLIKQTSLTPYVTCLHAYDNFKDPRCPIGAKTSVLCDQMARAQMDQICRDFVTMHSTYYIDIKL